MSISQIGLSALKAYQKAMATVSNNVANANTPGYSREEVNFAALSNRNGVEIQSIVRMFSEMDTRNLRDATSSFQNADALSKLSTYLEGAVINDPLNLNTKLSQMQSALASVNTNPTSETARSNFIAQLNQLANAVNTIGGQLQGQWQAASQQLSLVVGQVNDLTKNIAALNDQIAHTPEDGRDGLLDQRDQLIVSLSALTNVTVTDKGNGITNVTLANGEALVTGNQSAALSVRTDGSNPTEFNVVAAGSTVSLNDQIAGGQLRGVLSYVDDVVNPALNQLGLFAVGVATAYNAQNQAGFDLDGNAGGNVLNDLATAAPVVTAGQGNTGGATVTAQITSVNAAVASDYQLGYTGTNYTLTRLSDNTTVYTGATQPISVDGLMISVSGAMDSGDTFLISPYRQAGSQMAVAITDPRALAISNSPSQPSNNSNGLSMAQLQSQSLFGNGARTMSGQYLAFSSGISGQAANAQSAQSANQAILNQAEATRNDYSGVNLDEEAAKLMQYQQGYQAAAAIIAVERVMFDSILQAVR